MLVKQEDKDLVNNFFPDLYFEEINRDNYLKGKLKFVASFEPSTKDYNIYKDISSIGDKDNVIQDEYDIEINLSADNVYRLVKEVGGKIKQSPDMHINPHNGTACVAGYLDEDNDIPFRDFLCGIIIPFFYDQSFFRDNKKWPRGVFPHGCLGILVNYYEKSQKNDCKELTLKCIEVLRYLNNNNLDHIVWSEIANYLSKKRIKGRWACVCGWGKLESCSNCPPEVFKGLLLLKKNIDKYQLSI